jgi:hypothetical protein
MFGHGRSEEMVYGHKRGIAVDANGGACDSRGAWRLGEQGRGGMEDRAVERCPVLSAMSGRKGQRQRPTSGQVVVATGRASMGEGIPV